MSLCPYFSHLDLLHVEFYLVHCYPRVLILLQWVLLVNRFFRRFFRQGQPQPATFAMVAGGGDYV
jgi:hypothetical protein